jgi:prepilin-type N-terminal cleavage/methylation domain-containing protein
MSHGRRTRRKVCKSGGFTIIEVFVVLAVLGIIIALALPRYLGARRTVLVAEADNVLLEVKTAAWGHYQQYQTWAGLPTGLPLSSSDLFGVVPPTGVCWDFGIVSATGEQIVLRARANTSGRMVCGLLSSTATVDLTLAGDGASSRSQANL